MSKFNSETTVGELTRIFPGFAHFLNPDQDPEVDQRIHSLSAGNINFSQLCRELGREHQLSTELSRLNEAYEEWLSCEISSLELQQSLTNDPENLFLIDIRDEWERRQASLPNSHALTAAESESILEKAKSHKSVVLMCHHGVRSLYAASYFRDNGVPQAQSLRGGIDGYSCEVDPSVPRY